MLGRLFGRAVVSTPAASTEDPDWDSLLDDAPPGVPRVGSVAAKLRAAKRAAGRGTVSLPDRSPDRLPPGQVLTEGWPVLDLGGRPDIDSAGWRLRVSLEGRSVAEFDMAGLLALGARESVSDIH